MSIRSNSLPLRGDLSPELQDILRRNGMQAHIIRQGDGFQLAVQGHDSPLLTYPISAQQMKAMTDWGTNYANKNAYNTFAALVGNDFYVPRNFVHAIGLVSVSMAVWLGTDVGCILCGDCTTVSSWGGHLDSKQVSTCDVSVARSSCRVLLWFQTVQTVALNQESCRMAVTASTTRDSRQPFSLRNRMCWQTYRLSSLLWKWLHVNWNQPSHIMSLSPRRSISPMRSSRSVWTVTVS